MNRNTNNTSRTSDDLDVEVYHPTERDLDDEIIAHINATVRKPHFSKFDIIILILLWLVSAWSIAADRLISEDNEYMSQRAKYYISLSIPIATSAAAALKSVQVAIEVKSERDSAREAREAAVEAVIRARRNENININVAPNDISRAELPRTESRSCRRRSLESSDMPRRPDKRMIAPVRFSERQCFSMPTIKIINRMPSTTESANHSKLVYCEDSYSSDSTKTNLSISNTSTNLQFSNDT